MGAFLFGVALLSSTPPAATHARQPSDGDIVVTGERVIRSVRETSSSVFVVTQSEIEKQGANRVDQLLANIPNLQLGNGSQGPAIRGMDTTGPLSALPAFLGGNRPRTALIIDDRLVTYNEFVFGTAPLWDVARVEVFRSPQTTTQGQNSIAGAIFVNTNDPTILPEYRARAIVGDLKLRAVSVLASGPIAGDSIAIRLAGDFRYSRTSSKIDDVMRGADPSHDVSGLFRGKLLANLGSNTQAVLTYSHSQSQTPQSVGVSAPFRKRRDKLSGYGVFRVKVDSVTTSITHQAGSALTARMVLTAGDSSARRFAIPSFGETKNKGRDWSGEAIINWSPQGPFRGVAGASYTHVALKQFIDLALLSGSIGRFRDWQDGMGLFGDLEFSLSSRTKITAGLRYQRDRQKRKGALDANSFSIPVNFIGTFNAWLPKVTFSNDLSPELRVGAMVQKAYNAGGTTIRVDTSRPDDFKAETLWDYELFARGSIFHGAIRFETNLFYCDIRNAQRARDIVIFTPSGRQVGFANLINVPKARSFGAEGQLDWRASPSLSAKAAIGLLGTKIVRTDSESAVLDGNEFDRSPHFTASLGLDWQATDRLRISVQARHHGPYFSDPENSELIRITSGTNVDARAQYRMGRIIVFGQVRNVFDALNMLDLSDPRSGEAEDPRRFSIGLESSF